MGKRRKSPIARNLVKNSKAALLAAIEIHNKPTFSYRYEVVVLLALNAWELLLKGYIYKYHNKVKLFKKDGTTKQFPECVAFVASQLGNDFQVTKENIERIYEFRNNIAHFYSEKLDIIVFALLKRSVELYQEFILKYFNLDLSSNSDLVLLPIGFKKPYSPFDFISNRTLLRESSIEVKRFIQSIMDSTIRLNENGIEDPIISDFKVSLINEKRIKNADIIAGINNKIDTGIDITVLHPKQVFRLTNDLCAPEIKLTRDKTTTVGTFIQEELSEELFNEINNVIDTNNILVSGKQEFLFGDRVYYRIYAERDHVSYDVKNIELLARTGLGFYAPHLFWLAILPPKSCASIVLDFVRLEKNLQMILIIRFAVLLGSDACKWLFSKLYTKWSNHPQPPNYYWSLKSLVERDWKKDCRFVALKKNTSSTLMLPDELIQHSLESFTEDQTAASSGLSRVCFSVFGGNKSHKDNCRVLDVLTYGKEITNKSQSIMSEIMKLDVAGG